MFTPKIKPLLLIYYEDGEDQIEILLEYIAFPSG
jgi:hypothetical protein